MPIDGILKKYLTLTALQALFRFAATRYMYNWVTSLVAYIIRINLEFVQNSVMGKQMTSTGESPIIPHHKNQEN